METDFKPAEVFPVSDFIKEELEARGWSKSDFAEIIGRTPQFVTNLLSGKASITLETARRLGKAFETSAEMWMNIDTAYRLHSTPASDVDDSISERAMLYSIAPITDMIRRGWIPDNRSDIDYLKTSLCKFFQKDDLSEITTSQLVARKGTSYAVSCPIQSAWLARTVELARSTDAKPFSTSRFYAGLDGLKALAANVDDVRAVPRVLAEMGIRLVVVEHLLKTKIDGACFWLDAESPVVALSLRYGRIDYFWYTLGHELGHVVNRDGLNTDGYSSVVDEGIVGGDAPGPDEKPKEEKMADEFAAKLIVPQDRLESFIARKRPVFSQKSIVQFSQLNRVHPGLVLGQLQFRKLVSYSHLRHLLEDVRKVVLESTLYDGWGNVPIMETE